MIPRTKYKTDRRLVIDPAQGSYAPDMLPLSEEADDKRNYRPITGPAHAFNVQYMKYATQQSYFFPSSEHSDHKMILKNDDEENFRSDLADLSIPADVSLPKKKIKKKLSPKKKSKKRVATRSRSRDENSLNISQRLNSSLKKIAFGSTKERKLIPESPSRNNKNNQTQSHSFEKWAYNTSYSRPRSAIPTHIPTENNYSSAKKVTSS
mmetsp:Transcript_22118/g.34258  ORF Transcript_22118/g.34258 Transcript_22118/m.34258 type:complete len:208 (-) Transcript_22118:1379-2002(-)